MHGLSRLKEAVASVESQRFVTAEVQVVTDDARDETRQWLQGSNQFAAHVVSDQPSVAAVASEAARNSRAHWILFLDARDRLVGDMVLSEFLNWSKTTEAGVVAGENASDRGQLQKLGRRVNACAGDFTPRSATFYRRTLFDENAGFDGALGPAALYEFNLRLWKGRVRFKPIPLRIAASPAGDRRDRQARLNEIRVRHRYFAAWRCWPWDLISLLRAAAAGRVA